MAGQRRYLPLRVEGGGYVARQGVFYECLGCSDCVPSLPPESQGCRCGNVFIDVPFGRLSIRDGAIVRAFAEEGKSPRA